MSRRTSARRSRSRPATSCCWSPPRCTTRRPTRPTSQRWPSCSPPASPATRTMIGIKNYACCHSERSEESRPFTESTLSRRLRCFASLSMTSEGFRVTAIVAVVLLLFVPACAQHQQHRGAADLQEYIEILERTDRDKDLKPDEVIKALNLDRHMTIADLGARSGYFTRKFVWAVQDKGMD